MGAQHRTDSKTLFVLGGERIQFDVASRVGDLPPEYEALFDDAGRESLFLSRPWFELFEKRAIPAADRAIYFGLKSADAPRSLALLACRRPNAGWPFRMRSLDSLSNFYSMDYAPLISRDVDDPVPLLGALFGAMRRAGYRYDQVSLGPLDPESPRYGQLIAALRGQGYRAFVSFRIGNWFEPIGGRSFDAYMSGRPSVLRNTLQRRRKRLTKSADARITIITGGEQLEDAIRDYQAAYALSWKEPEIFPHFIPDLVRASAQLGCLRLGLLYIDNVPAAAQIWLISGSSAVIYKLAYDPRFQEFSVGSLLTEHLMRWVIERDHVKEVNYGSGDDSYKKEWMSCRREWIGLAAYNARSVRGMAQILAEQGRRLVKTVTQRASDGGSPP